MGASESDLSSVDTLRDQISALETRLSGISQQHQDFEVWPEAKDGRVLTICGARLQCRSDVSILTGPVIGKVTSTTALVLLETSKTVDVTMYVSLVDLDVPNGRVIASAKQRCEARKPTTISVSNLLPGESYVVTFSGVSRESASTRIGQLRTFDLEDRSLRILSVSCDSPDKVLSGEPNMWETLSERVLRKELPPVDLMVHLGGQVSMKKAFEDSWVILKRHSERSDLVPGEWASIEAEVLERLRSAYRFSWNLPYTREVLASCSHIMVCSDRDVYPNFTLDMDLSTDIGGRVTTTLLRLARRVYREYQRALWDREDLEELSGKEDEMVAKRGGAGQGREEDGRDEIR
ncbi:hypothetical protein TrRE_jg7088 [Triparma retinervis]|uniref:Uncharacterized protein n=1 Tax=Triparma retinervis TaxID=2557542 RepID=A0A9W6ZAS5_9STRA|nr:hypothetical protein TrRE_jg7088 [Triparma retinervis]